MNMLEDRIAELEGLLHKKTVQFGTQQDVIVKLREQLAEARKALLEIKEELEYDISNGKVALDIATDTLT